MSPTKERTILISPQGMVVFVQEDGHPAFDLGECKFERISDVIFNEKSQLWEVHLLKGHLAGAVFSEPDWTAGNRNAAIAWEVDYLNSNIYEILDLTDEPA